MPFPSDGETNHIGTDVPAEEVTQMITFLEPDDHAVKSTFEATDLRGLGRVEVSADHSPLPRPLRQSLRELDRRSNEIQGLFLANLGAS